MEQEEKGTLWYTFSQFEHKEQDFRSRKCRDTRSPQPFCSGWREERSCSSIEWQIWFKGDFYTEPNVQQLLIHKKIKKIKKQITHTTDILWKFKAKSCSLGNHREFCHHAYFPPLLSAKYLLPPSQLEGIHRVLPTLQTEEIKLHSCFVDLGRWRHMFHSFVSSLLKIYFNILTANIHTLNLIIQMAQNHLPTKHQNGWPFFLLNPTQKEKTSLINKFNIN